MKAVESEGTSVEEAVDRALLLLGLEAGQVEVQVIREPGANGAGQTAVVRVQPKGADSAAPSPPEVVSRPAPVALDPDDDEDLGDDDLGGEDLSDDEGEDVSGETVSTSTRRRHAADDEVPLTEEEGDRADRAGDFLEDLFERLDVDCYVEVAADRVDGKILIDIAGPDTGVIIGRKGAVLDAIELVLSRAMDNKDGGGIRISLDAEGYRERRAEKLRSVAADQARRVVQTKRPVSLEPMSARERRIIHMALKSDPAVQTRSEGEGPDRHIIIEPNRDRDRP